MQDIRIEYKVPRKMEIIVRTLALFAVGLMLFYTLKEVFSKKSWMIFFYSFPEFYVASED